MKVGAGWGYTRSYQPQRPYLEEKKGRKRIVNGAPWWSTCLGYARPWVWTQNRSAVLSAWPSLTLVFPNLN